MCRFCINDRCVLGPLIAVPRSAIASKASEGETTESKAVLRFLKKCYYDMIKYFRHINIVTRIMIL